MPTLRPYQQNDLQVLIDLFKRSVREIASRNYTLEQTVAWAPDVIDEQLWSDMLSSQETWIAEENGEAQGFVSLKRDGCVDLLFVDPRHERRGIGAELLDHAEKLAKNMGISQMYSQVSQTAHPQFMKRGYAVAYEMIVERRGQTFMNYRMEKKLVT